MASWHLLLAACALGVGGCAGDNDVVLADAADDAASAAAAKALLVGYAGQLQGAVTSLCAMAPLPLVTGWNPSTYPDAVASMRSSWKDAHRAYQGLEGVTDLLFPTLATAIDQRYEQALAVGPDEDLFDGQGFVGLHAVERILWTDEIPPSVVATEMNLPGYVAAAFPDQEQAAEFHYDLCARLVTDVTTLKQQIDALDLGSPDAYAAALRTVERQMTKMEEAGAGFDESRYSGTTLADMRADLAAAQATHEVFLPWLETKPEGFATGAEVAVGFARLDTAYAAIQGDVMPPLPKCFVPHMAPSPCWSSVDPSASMLAQPFGKLFVAVRADASAAAPSSLAGAMAASAKLMGIEE